MLGQFGNLDMILRMLHPRCKSASRTRTEDEVPAKLGHVPGFPHELWILEEQPNEVLKRVPWGVIRDFSDVTSFLLTPRSQREALEPRH